MVSLVLISHSRKIVEGLRELLLQAAPEVQISIAGGFDGEIGTDPAEIMAAIESVRSEHGAALLFDLGSASMNAEMAIELLGEEGELVKIVDAPLVEGAYAAVVAAGLGKTLEEVIVAAEGVRGMKKINR